MLTSILYGEGLDVTGTNSYNQGAVGYNVDSSIFQQMNTGIEYHVNTQGMTVLQSNFTGVINGIYTDGGGNTQTELSIMGSQFNATKSDLTIDSDLPDVIVSGNLLFVPNGGFAVHANDGQRMEITGNSIVCTVHGSNDGIFVTANDPTNSSIISGNNIQHCTNGVALGISTSGWVVGLNSYQDVATKVYNAGENNSVVLPGGFFSLMPMTQAQLAAADPSPANGDQAFVTNAMTCAYGTAIGGAGSRPCKVVYIDGWVGG